MQAVYYRAPDGSEPVDAFIEALADPDRQAVLDNQIERLNVLRPNDPPLLFPWSSQLEGELRELRCHYGSELYRVIYRRSRNLIVLLHIPQGQRQGARGGTADRTGALGRLQSADGRPAPAPAAGGRPRRALRLLISSGKMLR
jgi:hypothetical protein